MDPFTLMLIGGGTGILKNLDAKGQAADQREIESTKTRFSPWTGMKGQNVQEPSMLNDVMQGLMTGAVMGQMFGKAPGAEAAAQAPNPYAGRTGIMAVGPTGSPEQLYNAGMDPNTMIG